MCEDTTEQRGNFPRDRGRARVSTMPTPKLAWAGWNRKTGRQIWAYRTNARLSFDRFEQRAVRFMTAPMNRVERDGKCRTDQKRRVPLILDARGDLEVPRAPLELSEA